MTLSEWLRDEAISARKEGDPDRIRMMDSYNNAFALRETDPDGAFAAFTEGQQIARRRNEPWWVLYYEKYRIDALMHFKRDYRQVVDMAVQCVLDLNKPGNAAYPGRVGIWDSLLAAYLGVDAEGYAEPIQEAIDTLDREIPEGPSSDRYLLLARKNVFALERNRYRDAYDSCMAELQLASGDTDQSRGAHYATFVFCELCEVGASAQKWEQVGRWAKAAAELAEVVGHHCERAEAIAWQAVVALQAGKTDEAAQLLQSATTTAAGLGMPPNRGYFEALFTYRLLGRDLPGALDVREEELRSIENCGRLLRECRLHIQRCTILARLCRLRPEHLEVARAVAGHLRLPGPHLEQLSKFAVGKREDSVLSQA
jgi:hypothetical protein